MKLAVGIVVIMACLLMAASAIAGDVGRYQALKLRANEVLIVDTKEGYLWTYAMAGSAEGAVGILMYVGK